MSILPCSLNDQMGKRKSMKKFAVVLNWETETDTGYSPVLVAVNAESPEEALQIAIDQAKSTELYGKIYKMEEGEEPIEMEIHEDSSFACEIPEMTFIN